MKRSRIVLATTAMLTPLSALAQINPGSITFTPASAAATAVPTLGGTLLVLLALLLGVIAVRSVRHQRSSGTASVFAGALALGALASGVSGVALIQDVHAGVGVSIQDEAGETFEVPCGTGLYQNDSGVSMQVTELVAPTGCISDTNIAPEPACRLAAVVEDGNVCNTDYGRTPV